MPHVGCSSFMLVFHVVFKRNNFILACLLIIIMPSTKNGFIDHKKKNTLTVYVVSILLHIMSHHIFISCMVASHPVWQLNLWRPQRCSPYFIFLSTSTFKREKKSQRFPPFSSISLASSSFRVFFLLLYLFLFNWKLFEKFPIAVTFIAFLVVIV